MIRPAAVTLFVGIFTLSVCGRYSIFSFGKVSAKYMQKSVPVQVRQEFCDAGGFM